MYEKLKVLNKYHKRNGIEAILYKKYKEKRQRSASLHGPPKVSFQTRCIFTEGGVKCGERIIPCSKYCRKHILEDKKQVLFRACGAEKGGVLCQEPVASIFEDSTCMLHIQLQSQRNYSLKKYESESEDESAVKKIEDEKSIETTNQLPSSTEPIEIKMETLTDDVTATTFATAEEILPPKSIDDLKVDGSETNLTICHDTASTIIAVAPMPIDTNVTRNDVASVMEPSLPSVSAMNDMTMNVNESTPGENLLQPMDVDEK